MKEKVYVFLAEGYEETEALAVVDVLRRGGLEVLMVAIGPDRLVRSAHNCSIQADILIQEVDPKSAAAVVLPGGLPGATNLEASEDLAEIIRTVNANGGILAAICAAPVVYGKLGLLKGKEFTAYPSFEEGLEAKAYLSKAAVVDGNIITGRGPAYCFDFALAILEALKGQEKAKEIADAMLITEKC